MSPNVRAVTIREVPKIFAEMMMVLGQYDRDPATVTLNFQLIAAENSNTRDPGVAGLDSLLRGVLKYTGYRLLTTSVASASEGGIRDANAIGGRRIVHARGVRHRHARRRQRGQRPPVRAPDAQWRAIQRHNRRIRCCRRASLFRLGRQSCWARRRRTSGSAH